MHWMVLKLAHRKSLEIAKIEAWWPCQAAQLLRETFVLPWVIS